MSEFTAVLSSVDSTDITPASVRSGQDASSTLSGSVHAGVSEGDLDDVAATRKKFKGVTASEVAHTEQSLVIQNGRKP